MTKGREQLIEEFTDIVSATEHIIDAIKHGHEEVPPDVVSDLEDAKYAFSRAAKTLHLMEDPPAPSKPPIYDKMMKQFLDPLVDFRNLNKEHPELAGNVVMAFAIGEIITHLPGTPAGPQNVTPQIIAKAQKIAAASLTAAAGMVEILHDDAVTPTIQGLISIAMLDIIIAGLPLENMLIIDATDPRKITHLDGTPLFFVEQERNGRL